MTDIGCERAGHKKEEKSEDGPIVGSRSDMQENNQVVPLNIFLQQLAANANAGVSSTAQPRQTPKRAPKTTRPPKKAPAKKGCSEIEQVDNGSWVCDTNGFRFIYKNAEQSVHNTKCSLKCNDGFEATGFPNKNVSLSIISTDLIIFVVLRMCLPS